MTKNIHKGGNPIAAMSGASMRSRLLEACVSAIPDYVYGFDREKRFVFVNAAMERLYGLTAEDVIGRTLADLEYPQDLAERLNGHIDTIFATGQTIRGEVFYESSTGVGAWFDYVWGPVLGSDGAVDLVVGVSRDTTDRRRLEDEIKASEEWQAYLLHLSDALRQIAEPVAIQEEACRMLGEHLGVDRAYYVEIDMPTGLACVDRDYVRNGASSLAGKHPIASFSWSIDILKQGECHVVQDAATSAMVPDADRAALAALDIAACMGAPLVKNGQLIGALCVTAANVRPWQDTEIHLLKETAERIWAAIEQARAEKALREREAELARVQEIGRVAGFDVDLTTMTTSRRSPEYRRLHGLPTRVVAETHQDWLKRVHPEDRKAADAAVRDAIAGDAASYHSEYRVVRPKDKKVRWILAKGDIERGGDGKPVRMVGAHIDITERKAAEEAVRLSEHRLARVLESISDGLIIVGADGLVTFVNAAAQQMLAAQGVDTNALVGLDYRDTLAPIAGVLTQAHFDEVMDDRQAFEFEFRHEDWDMWFSVRAFPVREGGISIYFHDITAAKAAQAALRDSEAELQRTLDSISDAFLIVDTDWRFSYLNAAVRRIWEEHGVDAGDMMGKDVLTAFEGVAGTIFEKELRRTLVLRIPTRFEYHYAPWDRWYSCRCYPIVGNGASLYLLDITERKAMEQGLRASEDYLNRLVESIGNRLAVLDTEWRFRFMNAGARDAAVIDGRDPEQLLGQSIWEAYPQLLDTPMEEQLRGAMYDRVASSFEFEHAGRWLMMNVFPIAGDGITLYGQDITAQKQLELALRDSETRWRTLTDAMPQIVWIGQADTGQCTYVNDQCVRYTGAPAEAFLGYGWAHFIHPDDRDMAREEWRLSYERRHIFDVEFRMRRFDGQFRWFKVRGVPMTDADGNVRQWYGTCTDIQDMMEARFRAESANRAKSEFLANMSHEIRTPLNAIVGLTSLLLRFGADPATQHKYLTTLKDSAGSLTELIGDVLDYARMDFGHVELQQEEFRLLPLLEEVMRIAGVKADEKGLETALHTDAGSDVALIGDAVRIKQILMNLTANAVKFTPAGRVDLVAVAAPADDGRVNLTVTVKDTGIGIAAGQLDYIFETFTQADSSITRRFGGTGLGLAISRRLAEAMGGSISVTSQVGTGSAFTLRLRLPAAVAAPETPAPPARADGQLRVLVVEDNAVNAMVTRDMLTRLGHTFVVAEDGRAALAAWRDGPFDAVLMDVQMPEMDGVQATHRIRQMERAGTAPAATIIAMTAHATGEDRDRCLAAGMDDYLSKPFTIDALMEKLERVRV